MPVKVILFDLDGTLLPMDQDAFVRRYFKLLAAELAPHGYAPEALIGAIRAGMVSMTTNDGSMTNEEAFWNTFCSILGERVREDIPLFDAFYRTRFAGAKEACGFNPAAAQTVKALKERGLRVALATNPLFPSIATQQRIRWAGLDAEDFELVTTYENSRFCKPNPAYYREILEKLGAAPEECLMVGNDVGEDMIAGTLGMKVFLLTDCLINSRGEDVSQYPHGGFEALNDYIQAL